MVSKAFLSSLLLLGILFFQPVSASAQNKKQSYSALAKDVLRYVNEHREKKRLPPLVMNEVISESAEKHSSNMAKGKVSFGHDGFNGRVGQIKKKVKPINAWAENVAMGVETAEEVVDLWLHSPGHKKNIEGRYNLTGIGIAKDSDGQLYFTQIFVNKD